MKNQTEGLRHYLHVYARRTLLSMLLVVFPVWLAADCAVKEGYQMPRKYSAEERRLWFRPGPVWDGTTVAEDELTRADVDAYAAGPLYWLGEQFLGYNLQPPARFAVDQHRAVYFPYGWYCTEPTAACNDGTGSAYTVSISDICTRRPPDQPPRHGAKLGKVRGSALMLQEVDGTIELWTGDVRVTILALVDTKQGRRAVDTLRGIGQVSGHIGPGDPLPPPNFSRC